ncbi:hypothetical protein RO3G_04083 [Rhizopus delemar RA 99-880]|uniref:Uncharacterized protein n=1 Tax=Rhizopus delemar (strain RA 99-880 / ATCC MYA-4621 / FGSC 9543 / NRRL 43880) TaxID=246409 RepID=I1BT48_RHIO9|nr:hypothetical protein RO3G_04083 [Rhizopus delemar RA 99-880]|eukprot:EIE79378.1 hypothetical protein RO3G_04083 [Rhizopus delemar RA 99-880]
MTIDRFCEVELISQHSKPFSGRKILEICRLIVLDSAARLRYPDGFLLLSIHHLPALRMSISVCNFANLSSTLGTKFGFALQRPFPAEEIPTEKLVDKRA